MMRSLLVALSARRRRRDVASAHDAAAAAGPQISDARSSGAISTSGSTNGSPRWATCRPPRSPPTRRWAAATARQLVVEGRELDGRRAAADGHAGADRIALLRNRWACSSSRGRAFDDARRHCRARDRDRQPAIRRDAFRRRRSDRPADPADGRSAADARRAAPPTVVTIVGIAPTVRQRNFQEALPDPVVYVPLRAQAPAFATLDAAHSRRSGGADARRCARKCAPSIPTCRSSAS